MFARALNKELLLVSFLYLFMAISYYMALVLDTGIVRHYWPVVLNYLLKALISIPFWWLFFRTMAMSPIWQKGLLHLVALPVYTILWVQTYYHLCDSLGFFRLRDSRVVWDYYMTALFYIIQFGNFHFYIYYKQLREQQLLAAQLKQLTLQSELSILKAQLNPHFLYNVFNTINAAIPASAKHARDMINKLSDLFRYQLKTSTEELVTIREELDFVVKYLELEKERFNDRLSFLIETEEAYLEDKVPPMILQPIVENAVKHGLSPLIEGGVIEICIQKNKKALDITISDTGIGVDGQEYTDMLNRGVGLSNTNERLMKMYGEALKLEDNQPRGLVVQFSIPSC